VNDGSYDNAAFHRALPGFIVQGGAFKTTFTANEFLAVGVKPSPLNEPGISNLPGTLAMAKVGGRPHSATHDFFFNLVNNVDNLDNQNGGFTVFGRVAGSGMTVVNQIVNLPKGNYAINLKPTAALPPVQSGPYSDWPINQSPAPQAMNSALISKMTAITALPKLTYAFVSSSDPAVATGSVTNGVLSVSAVGDGTANLTVEATDVDGATATHLVPITVQAGYLSPVITTQPTTAPLLVGEVLSLSVVATGTDIAYQWKKDGVDISVGTNPTATSNTLTIASVTGADNGTYTVVVSNLATSVTSNGANVVVNVPAAITTQPASLTVPYHGQATFSVVATGGSGNANLTYQWRANDVNISGATSATYTIPSVPYSATPIGYSVVVTSPGINSVPSGVAYLTVTPIDSDGDSIYDHDEVVLQTNPNLADTDGDGYSDGIELGQGTDPKSNASRPVSTTFLAAIDGAAELTKLPMRYHGTGAIPNRRNAGSLDTLGAGWFATNELTNVQFASVLQRAKQDDIISITTVSGRREVRHPKVAGQLICYLKTPAPAAGAAPSCDIDLDSNGASFTVAAADRLRPVRAVTWHGAYLAAAVLNTANGYVLKNQANFTFGAGNGYYIPSYTEWELVARGATVVAPTYGTVFPTGASATTTTAWFGQISSTATPKNVGSHKANPLGIFDLGGNVAEWIGDNTAGSGYVRGGGFASAVNALRNDADEALPLTTVRKDIGIRLALAEAEYPSITTQPQHRFQRTDVPLTLTVAAAGAQVRSYQWYRNTVAIAGQTAATLTIPSPTTANAGDYTCRVTSNGQKSVLSAIAKVALVQAFTTPPLKTVKANSQAIFSAVAAGGTGQTFTYQWKFGGQNIAINTQFANPQTKNLTVSIANGDNTGDYTCEVSLVSVPVITLPAVQTTQALLVKLPPLLLANASQALSTIVSSDFIFDPALAGIFDASPSRYPTKWLITGLPPGLKYDPLTGIITGHPTKAGTFLVKITPETIYGKGAPATKEIQISSLHANSIGTFVGYMADNQASMGNVGGRVDFKVTGTGAYSGKFTHGKVSYPIKGILTASLSADPTGRVVIPRKGLSSLRLKFAIDRTTQNFVLAESNVGVLGAGGAEPSATAAIKGWRGAWIATVNSASSYLGSHNMAWSETPTSVTDQSNLRPQGHGHGTLKVSLTGVTTLAMKLPDGSAVATSAILSPTGGRVIAFQSLYANSGSLVGEFNLAPTTHVISTGAAPLSWKKAAQGSTSADRIYKAGFSMTLASVGGLYDSTHLGNASILGGFDPIATGQKNANIAFGRGGLTADHNLDFVLTTAKTALISLSIADNPKKVSFTFDKVKGTFKGTFQLSDPNPVPPATPNVIRTVSYTGILVPTASNAAKAIGYGFFTMPKLPNAAPDPRTILNSNILGGSVSLTEL
jgi:cyclophilin family peptidyl-prolyl cis-trans isomerase/formylglycine-generating enzyme required for sulfatase activity